MDNFWFNFALEIGLFSLLGVMYYFYQKRKILKYEENKVPLVMDFLLQACLEEKKDGSQPLTDSVIEALDDFLKKKTQAPPIALLRTFAESPDCTPELRHAILEGLKELD